MMKYISPIATISILYLAGLATTIRQQDLILPEPDVTRLAQLTKPCSALYNDSSSYKSRIAKEAVEKDRKLTELKLKYYHDGNEDRPKLEQEEGGGYSSVEVLRCHYLLDQAAQVDGPALCHLVPECSREDRILLNEVDFIQLMSSRIFTWALRTEPFLGDHLTQCKSDLFNLPKKNATYLSCGGEDSDSSVTSNPIDPILIPTTTEGESLGVGGVIGIVVGVLVLLAFIVVLIFFLIPRASGAGNERPVEDGQSPGGGGGNDRSHSPHSSPGGGGRSRYSKTHHHHRHSSPTSSPQQNKHSKYSKHNKGN